VNPPRQDTAQALTIGEVLSLLQEEFPEISISKIRFLESQGLIEPERTPSGYRKFYPHDIERLRWILRQQRDNFLPLKVIRDKLDHPLDDGDSADTGAQVGSADGTDGAAAGGDAAASSGLDTGAGGEGEAGAAQVRSASSPQAGSRPSSPLRGGGGPAVSLTREELAEAAGLEVRAVVELERYGLVAARTIGPAQYYDAEALAVARLAAGMRAFGVDARHLRMYKTAADREAGVYEQVVGPLVRQRNPASRQRARTTLDDLASLGEALHHSMLRQALRGHLES
jgi:DNA-binding transcriptional MerR regulator